MSFVETTLSSPLLEAGYHEFFHGMENPKIRPTGESVRVAQAFVNLPGAPSREGIIRHIPEITRSLSHLGRVRLADRSADASATISDCLDFVKRYCDAIRRGLATNTGLDPGGISNLNLSGEVRQATLDSYLDLMTWLNLVEACAKAARTSSWERSGPDFASRRFAVVKPESGPWVLLTYDTVLMFKDMMFSRFLINCLGGLDPDRTYLERNLAQFVTWGESVLERFGNPGYELIKGIEALVKVRIVEISERWLDAKKQAFDMVRKYMDKEIALGGTGHYMLNIWSLLRGTTFLPELGDYFGFLKIMGHPYVNPRDGCLKVQKLVHTKDKIELLACRELGYSFCHVYTRGYLEANSKWPPIVFSPHPSGKVTRLELLARKEHPVLSFGFTQYDPSDWDHAVFAPHMKFDYGDDFLELLSDKALSHPRSEFDTMWMGSLDYKPPRATGSKRVLEQVLTKGRFNMEEIVRVVQEGRIPDDWRIVSVSPKEREMKLDPRMFSKMVLEMRSFFVLTEKNLKEGVFKVIKEQTMTLNRQALLDRFLQVTRPRGERWARLTVEIDYSSWNLHFCSSNNDPVGERLNQIYGEAGVYTAAHPFFDSCLIVMDHGQYPPEGLCERTRADVLAGEMYLDTIWSGHDRGFEGITQGVWTLATIALGHMAIHDLGLNFVQNGQGDNQVYTFDIFIPSEVADHDVQGFIRNVNKEVLRRLETQAYRVGHEIKPEECICSTSFFSYGKEMFVDGTYLPSLCKFLSRIFPTTSSDVPSTYEYISTVASGGTAATEKSNVSLSCLALTKFTERLTIKRELTTSIVHGAALSDWTRHLFGEDRNQIATLLDLLCIVPGNLGGLPISSPLEFLYRGHADPLASSILSMQLLRSIPGVTEYLLALAKGWPLKEDPDPTGLVLDPYSIPLQRPSPASVRVTAAVIPVLHDVIKNEELGDLKDVITGGDREALYSWLGSVRPLYPKVLHDLYKSSNVGVLDALAKRFTNTRTLFSMSKRANVDLLGVAISSDLLFMTKVMETLALAFKVGTTDYESLINELQFENQFRFVVSLRDRWKVGNVEGVSNLHPFASGRLLSLPEDSSLVLGREEILVTCQEGSSHLCETTRGNVTPYLGSKTEDKTVGKWVKPVSSSPPLRDVIAILNIQEMMCTEGSEMWKGLDKLAQSRCSLPLETVRQFTRVKRGGNNAHRFHTRDDIIGSFVNISTNWPSHLVVSSNNAGLVGAVDYPFDFQEAFTGAEGLLSWMYYRLNKQAPFGILIQVDVTRMDPVEDHIINSDVYGAELRPLSESYYLTANSVSVSSNALTAARFTQDGLRMHFRLGEPTIDDALTATIYNHLTGRLNVSARLGKTLGKISHKRLVDMPEISLITRSQIAESLSIAILHKCAYAVCLVGSRTHKERSPLVVLRKMFQTEIRRVSPSLYGTLCDADTSGTDPGLRIGLDHPDSDRGLLTFMSRVSNYPLDSLTYPPLKVFLRGNSSVSRTLTSILSMKCLGLLLRGDAPSFKQGKDITFITKAILKDQDEMTKVRKLVALAIAVGWEDYVIGANESPEERLRKLREKLGAEPPVPSAPRCTAVYTPPSSCVSLRGLGNTIAHSPCTLSRAELLESWKIRDHQMPDSATRWAPLQSAINKTITNVLVIGVGDGNLGAGFNPAWNVTGVDLGASLAKRGHSMVNFVPPFMPCKFSLHPVSWTLGGDITSKEVRSLLLGEAELGVYDLVIIDVDRVPPHTRLLLRQVFALTGVLAVCRVFVSKDSCSDLEHSVMAVAESGDFIWSTLAFPDNEFIIGGGAAPLGLFDSDRPGCRCPRHTVPISKDSLIRVMFSQTDTQVYVLEVSGDFLTTGSTLNVGRCRGLWSYLPENLDSPDGIILHMLKVGAPRRRVKAAFELFRRGILTL
jgi:hypothetical protein